MTQPYLIVLHQANANAGRIGHALKRRGLALDIRCPRFGDPLPDTMAEHAGAIVLGGSMSANDRDEFIRREIDWIAVPLKEQKPYLGVCLGAEMLARALGCKVDRDPQGRAEIGYYPIRPTALGRGVCGAWPERVYQWHQEGFDLPGGAELIAEGDIFPVQAFRYGGTAFGVQFHPEVTGAMMHQWTVSAHAQTLLPGAKPAEMHFADRARYDDASRAWLATFLDRWLGEPGGQPSAHRS